MSQTCQAVVCAHSPMTATDGYIVEFIAIGNSVRVTAMDPKTLTEVAIIGPAGMSREALSRQAIRKLEYVLQRTQR